MSKQRKHLAILMVASVFFAAALTTTLSVSGWKHRSGRAYSSYLPAAVASAAGPSLWIQAVEKVKEDRGEPAGKQAKVSIPSEVRHYRDTRRFLAIQVAEAREYGLQTPRDLVDLSRFIERGEMVAVQPVTENYILFGVGGRADNGPFSRYEDRESISLYDEPGLNQEYARIAESQTSLEREIGGLRKQLGSLNRRDRAKRARLQAQISRAEKTLKAEAATKKLLDQHYGDVTSRARFFSDYASLEGVAKSFRDRTFDIGDPGDRLAMKVRLLSSLRPEALKVLEDIASSYREKFDRPLPITSLVRPDEYQHELSKVNPNATRIATPPHSTGLAFDIMYRYMTAQEQSFLMDHLARLKEDGRIEVLRENRDHYHVFAFIDGARPNEELIAASMGKSAAPKTARTATMSHHAKKAAPAKRKATRVKRNTVKSGRKHR